ncbi:TPA: hypothetical protein ACGOYL_001236 [Streptococcus suis]
MKKKLFVGFFSLILIILSGCSGQALDGTWQYVENDDSHKITLVIEENTATVSIQASEEIPGLFGTSNMTISGNLLVGEIDTKEKVIKVTEDPKIEVDGMDGYASQIEQEVAWPITKGDTIPYSLSDDRKTLTLDIGGEGEFVKEE